MSTTNTTEATTLTLYVHRDGVSDDGRKGTLADAVELASAEECRVLGFDGDRKVLTVEADGNYRWH